MTTYTSAGCTGGGKPQSLSAQQLNGQCTSFPQTDDDATDDDTPNTAAPGSMRLTCVQPSGSSGDSSGSSHVGLGVGLGLGIPLVLAALFLSTRRKDRTRRQPTTQAASAAQAGAYVQMRDSDVGSAPVPSNPVTAAPTPGYDDDTRPPGELPDTGWTALPETFTLKTRDVRNYTVGQHVDNVGTGRNLSGTVVNIERSGSSGHMGTITVQPGGGR